jgi:hypothetical protein
VAGAAGTAPLVVYLLLSAVGLLFLPALGLWTVAGAFQHRRVGGGTWDLFVVGAGAYTVRTVALGAVLALPR